MAARSPVTIESSPFYEAHHAPSITPEDLRQSASNVSTSRSSPQLLSPSSFVRPRPQPLKSGSRIQQVPAGAQAGFATAASIWKQSKEGNALAEHVDVDQDLTLVDEQQKSKSKRRDPMTKSTGKLTRPKKTPKSASPALTTEASLEGAPRKSVQSKEKSIPKVLPTANVEGVALHGDVAQSRRSSINLSEYSFNAEPQPASLLSPSKSVPQITSVGRKYGSKKTIPGDAPTLKKSRKSKAKSEAIILDSDEPEEVLDEANPHVSTELLAAAEVVAKKPRPRKTKESRLRETKGEDATTEPVTLAKKRKVVGKSTESSTEKSVYFEQHIAGLPSSPPPVAPPELHTASAHLDTGETNAINSEAGFALSPGEIAPRRRRSWTPVKDSLAEKTTNTSPAPSAGLTESTEQVPFSALLGNFSYLKPEIALAERTTSGEAITKRRRIELSEHSAAPQPPSLDTSKAESVSKAGKSARKPRAIPKKPQTVTALALAAYQPPKELDPVQSTVSTYFPPQKEVEKMHVAKDGADNQELVAKVKKPRKSRAKTSPTEGDIATTKKSAKAKPKTTKVKVKFDKTEHVAPLYSPTQACKQMRAQDFIFGTSSQLAADESPDFVRDMQLAIHQSELAFPMPNSSQIGTQPDPLPVNEGKSCTSVPSAPHGTCLSVEQAHRELWCASARDSTGSKLAPEIPMPLHEAPPPAAEQRFERVIEVVTLSSSGQETLLDHVQGQQKMLGSQPNSESSATREILNPSEDANLTVPITPCEGVSDPQVPNGSVHPLMNDSWTILKSDDSASLPQATIAKPHDRTFDLATSPARRTALRPLDANISMIGSDSVKKLVVKPQAHSFSTIAASLDKDTPQIPPTVMEGNTDSATTVSPKRGRGRPRKDLSLERSVQTSPARGRGRPRKTSVVDNAAATSPARGRGRPRKDTSTDGTGVPSPKRPMGRPRKEVTGACLASMSPKRSVGRPRKNDAASRALSVSPERPVVWPRQINTSGATSPRSFRKVVPGRPSASQPTCREEWTKIDEISDTDSPNTPSPRRRRASSSPAHILPLDFDAPLSPSVMPKATIAGNAALRATDAVWPTIQASIFPQIAETIKAAPLGKDTITPSWHEKILLYDPIVLEDLTAWLNEQGLRTEVERLKVKTKARGRKKKDAPPEVDEWETIRDELKPWMVQKWCEDNSICCLWKEGLRGGVKARY